MSCSPSAPTRSTASGWTKPAAGWALRRITGVTIAGMVSALMRSQSSPLQLIRSLRSQGASHYVVLRYLLVGGLTAAVYLGLGILLSGPGDMNIQLAIPIAYAVSLAV